MAKRRRQKGTGTLRKRGSRWYAEIQIETTEGRTIARQAFRTKGAAENWLKTIAEKEGAYQFDPTKPMGPLVKRWLDGHCKTVEPNTRLSLEYAYKLALPYLDSLTVATSTPMEIDRWMGELTLTQDQRYRVFKMLRQFYKWCVRMGEMRSAPTSVLSAPKVERRKAIVLTEDQCRAFLEAAGETPNYSLFVVLLTCAIRPGEAFALQWEDVDLETGTIHIRQTLEDLSNSLRLKAPKTKGSERRIPLPLIAREAVEQHAAKGGRKGFVWKSSRGKPFRRTHFSVYYLRPILKAAGLPPIRTYDLRHTGITIMLLKTKNLRRVSSVAGHANPSVTLRHYAHLVDMRSDEFLNEVDAAFRPAPNSGQNNVQPTAEPEPESDSKPEESEG